MSIVIARELSAAAQRDTDIAITSVFVRPSLKRCSYVKTTEPIIKQSKLHNTVMVDANV